MCNVVHNAKVSLVFLPHLRRAANSHYSPASSMPLSLLYGTSHLPERISNIGFDRESRARGEQSSKSTSCWGEVVSSR